MEMNLNKMTNWERKKAIYLLGVAEDLGMNTCGYGELSVNMTSGYTYLWLEDYMFTLYMPINCELKKDDVWASWFNGYNGEEEEMQLESDTTLSDLDEWAIELENNAEEE